MLLPLLHGLKFKHNSVTSFFNFKTVVATNAQTAPIGKSTGNYLLDGDAALASVTTENLPDLSGFLKKVRIDFDLERVTSERGDFIVATAHPSLPNNLGAPVISEVYLEALEGRKYICDNFSGIWSTWREIRSDNSVSLFKTADSAEPAVIGVDPVTLRNYYIELNPGADVTIELHNSDSPYFTEVNFDFNMVGSSYTLTWPAGIIWANETNSPPPDLAAGTRLNVTIKKTRDEKLYASFKDYKG